jgi:hypothetical protein
LDLDIVLNNRKVRQKIIANLFRNVKIFLIRKTGINIQKNAKNSIRPFTKYPNKSKIEACNGK